MEIKVYLTDLKNAVTILVFFLKLFSTLQVEPFLKMLSVLLIIPAHFFLQRL